MANDLAVLTDSERAAILLRRDAAWAFVQQQRLAPQLAPVLDDESILLACYDAARAEVTQADTYIGEMAETLARLTAERDAARAALAEYADEANWDEPGLIWWGPDCLHGADHARAALGLPPVERSGWGRAVARARAATGGQDAPEHA